MTGPSENGSIVVRSSTTGLLKNRFRNLLNVSFAVIRFGMATGYTIILTTRSLRWGVNALVIFWRLLPASPLTSMLTSGLQGSDERTNNSRCVGTYTTQHWLKCGRSG